jgi:hypothetical protein
MTEHTGLFNNTQILILLLRNQAAYLPAAGITNYTMAAGTDINSANSGEQII